MFDPQSDELRSMGASLGVEREPLDAVCIASMAPGERVTIRTRNSVYELVMLQPTQQRVFISGGRHFPHLTEASLVGCSDRGRRGGWIAQGRRLEIAVGARLFVTSSIVNVECEAEDAGVALRQAAPPPAMESPVDAPTERELSPPGSVVLGNAPSQIVALQPIGTSTSRARAMTATVARPTR